MVRVATLLCVSALLAGCASDPIGGSAGTSAAIPGGPTVISGSDAPVTFVAGPPGCAGPISEYQRLIDRDAESGMLNPGVYNRVRTDLEPVKTMCAEGREKEAVDRLAAVRRQYGYR
jgi:hypothetical protein